MIHNRFAAYAGLISLIIVAAGGCATIQAAGTRSTEQVLSAAGFHVEAADTPARTAALQTMPARRVLPLTRDGQVSYVYRDPSVCHCFYVGGEPEYREYRKLRLQKEIADDEMDPWGTWNGWDASGIRDAWPQFPVQ
jgi:hypothetical protein